MKKLIATMALFLLAALGLFAYFINFSTTQVGNLWLDVYSGHSAGWQITILQDGEELSATAEEAIDFSGTVVLRRTVPEAWLSYETIALSGQRPMFVFGDDVPVFSNCVESMDQVGEISDVTMPDGQSFDVSLSMNSSWVSKTITVVTALFDDEPFGSIGFALESKGVLRAQASADVMSMAFPGVSFGVLALLLFGLFLFRSTKGKGALPLLLLAAGPFVQMLSTLDGMEGNPIRLIFFTSILAFSVLLLLLFLSPNMGS